MADDGKPGGRPKAGRTGDVPVAGRPSDVVGPRAKAPPERPFDMWLQKQLHAMYDEIASEPLPDNLLNLIDGDAENGDRGKGKTSG
jgi:hypothetical protein